jgi:lysophospholipase L1-like esterase
LQLINPSTSPNELNTTLTPHSIIHGDACFAYFNKIWGIPLHLSPLGYERWRNAIAQYVGAK